MIHQNSRSDSIITSARSRTEFINGIDPEQTFVNQVLPLNLATPNTYGSNLKCSIVRGASQTGETSLSVPVKNDKNRAKTARFSQLIDRFVDTMRADYESEGADAPLQAYHRT